MKTILVALVLIFCGSAFCAGDDFIGVWTDNFGYTLNLCLTNGGSRLEGAYNEFGLIQADVTDAGETATGSYYETSYFSSPLCSYGRFSFSVSGNLIVGTYACWDGLSGGDWNASRVIPQETPSLADCVVLAEGGSLKGQWAKSPQVQNNWDICINGDQFEASFTSNDGQPGYQWGDIFYDGRLLQGSYSLQLDEDGHRTKGGILLTLYQDGSLFSFAWKDPITTDGILNFYDPETYRQHQTLEFIQPTGSASKKDCSRNKFLKTGDDADYFIGFDSISTSEVLSVSVLAVFAIAFALF